MVWVRWWLKGVRGEWSPESGVGRERGQSKQRKRQDNILSKRQHSLHGDIHNHHALGSEMERQNLQPIRNQQARESDVVKDSKDPDKHQLRIPRRDIRLIRVLVNRTRGSPARKRNHHARRRDQEHRPSSKPIDVQRSRRRDDQVENRLARAHGQLLVLIINTRTLVDRVHVVAEQGIAAVLRDDAQTDDDGQPPPVALCPEEVEVARGAVGRLLHADGLLDLVELELHGPVVHVAAGVPFSQRQEGVLVSLLVDEEAGRLGDEPDSGQLDEGGDDLD